MTRRRSSAPTRPITLFSNGIRGTRYASCCGRDDRECECRTVIAGPAFAHEQTQEIDLSGDELAALYFTEQAGLVGSR